MVRVNNNVFDNYKKQRTSILLRDIIASVCCFVFVLVSFVISFSIKNSNTLDNALIPNFVEALDQGEYSDALSMYRSIHDDVVSYEPGTDELIYKKQLLLMNEMEKIVDSRLSVIESKMRNERYILTVVDIRFIDELGELTSSQMSSWLNSLCVEFLLGTIEKPDITFIFGQVSVIENISPSLTPLERDIETIEMSRGDAMDGESFFIGGNYIEAIHSYNTIVESTEGFSHDYALSRIEEIKELMYSPMIEEGENMLLNYRFYSAEEFFSDLAEIFPDDSRINADLLEATAHTEPTSVYHGDIEVICIRSLISNDEYLENDILLGSNSNLHLTTNEFSAMLQELYDNDYCLVDAESLVIQDDPNYLIENSLVVPNGKKPLIIVIEALDYSASDYLIGCSRRLVLNDQGQVCSSYIDSEGQEILRRDNEAIGILDQFVEDNPSFTFNGAKGVISIAGYESVFGYIINEDQIDDREQALRAIGYPVPTITEADINTNISIVASIAQKLRETGWRLASSTYGFINAYESSYDEIVSDTVKWEEEISSVIGDVNILIYPGGNYINGTDERANYLKSQGLRIFMGIGSNSYYTYGDNYLYYDRAIINYDTLDNPEFSRLFSYEAIVDPRREE